MQRVVKLYRTVRLWDLAKSNKPVETFEGHRGVPNCVAALSGCHDETVRVWDPAETTEGSFEEIVARLVRKEEYDREEAEKSRKQICDG